MCFQCCAACPQLSVTFELRVLSCENLSHIVPVRIIAVLQYSAVGTVRNPETTRQAKFPTM